MTTASTLFSHTLPTAARVLGMDPLSRQQKAGKPFRTQLQAWIRASSTGPFRAAAPSSAAAPANFSLVKAINLPSAAAASPAKGGAASSPLLGARGLAKLKLTGMVLASATGYLVALGGALAVAVTFLNVGPQGIMTAAVVGSMVGFGLLAFAGLCVGAGLLDNIKYAYKELKKTA